MSKKLHTPDPATQSLVDLGHELKYLRFFRMQTGEAQVTLRAINRIYEKRYGAKVPAQWRNE